MGRTKRLAGQKCEAKRHGKDKWKRRDHCTRECERSGNRSAVSEARVKNKAVLLKQECERLGAWRQGTEGPISRTYGMTLPPPGDSEGPWRNRRRSPQPGRPRREVNSRKVRFRGGESRNVPPNFGNDLLGSSKSVAQDKSSQSAWVRWRAGWQSAGKAVLKMLPSLVKEGVGGRADCDSTFLAAGDDHPGARPATPP